MITKQKHFFSTREEQVRTINQLLSQFDLRLIECGAYTSELDIREFDFIGLDSDFGYLFSGKRDDQKSFIIAKKNAQIEPDWFETDEGEKRFLIDMTVCKCGFLYGPSLMYGDEFIFPGIFKVLKSSKAFDNYKLFCRAFFMNHKKVKSFEVSPKAFLLMQKGVRLTQGANAAKFLDLKDD